MKMKSFFIKGSNTFWAPALFSAATISGDSWLCPSLSSSGESFVVPAGLGEMVKNWLGWQVKADSMPSLTRWLGRSKISRFRKNVLAAVLAGLVYNLWKARNLCVWEKKKLNVAEVFERTRSDVLQRVHAIWPKKVSTEDTIWFQSL
uniref:Uncharacterized protein n=1 Tax=Cannabis sativa TaxID=3483 RepID=A0A803QGR8_CANSA